MLCLPVVLGQGRHPLALGREMEPNQLRRQVLQSQPCHFDAEAVCEHEHGLLRGGGLLQAAHSVTSDGLRKQISVALRGEELGPRRAAQNVEVLPHPYIGYCHLVHGQGASLVRADGVRSAHNLA